ncbi:hypothetical protein FBUS_04631 [Fasciolopsis buskii]|uniref:Uncharacterized protein n=1 Tax=Fasciolopsis buskii TaxID=27845 RepID=A0A8E0RTY2_9TREM|nr:hypothetical protein FBUS_04631 [Fasciolopsis buski]
MITFSYGPFCSYGPAGKCCTQSPDPNLNSSAAFSSLREYERHLVSRHLKRDTLATVYSNGSMKTLTDPVTSPSSSRWSVYNSVVNLPAVLNDPTYRQVCLHCSVCHLFTAEVPFFCL